MIFLDTSVIVAASYDAHPDHIACIKRLDSTVADRDACSLHTLSEVFAVLTGLPRPVRLSCNEAAEVVERIGRGLRTIQLSPSEHLSTVLDLAARGLTGGMVYDALLLSCARKSGASEIYTLNLKHFRMIAPDLASRILLP